MRNPRCKRAMITVMTGVLAAHALQTTRSEDGPAAPPKPEPASASYVPIFDGRSLDQFEVIGNGAAFRVHDGEIIGTPILNRENSYLRTTRADFIDFTLEVEFLVRGQLNSGVQLRSATESSGEGRTRVIGYQVEIDPSARAWTGGIFDEGRRGWLANLEGNEAARQAFKHRQWNLLKITCRGDSIETWINGVAAATLKDRLDQRGFIALQIRSIVAQRGNAPPSSPAPEIRWRNLRIIELQPRK